MKLRNRLIKQQFRSYKNLSQFRDQSQNQERQYQKELNQIQVSLQIMNTSFKNNIKIQEIYLDLIKARTKNVNFKAKDIQNVYNILSENKTAQIHFVKAYQKDEQDRRDKEENLLLTNSFNQSKFKDLTSKMKATSKAHFQQQSQNNGQKLRNSQEPHPNESIKPYIRHCISVVMLTYRRLHSRLIEAIVKKLTYYILNKTHLHKIILHTVSQITKKLETLMRRLLDFKDFKFLFQVIRLIYQENYLIQQKIYEVIVNEGHVISIQQFFRINGIMLQETQITKRNSRLSILSNQRLSILSKEPLHVDPISQNNTKDSKFYQNSNKSKSKQKNEQEKNILYVQRLNKEIQVKYAAALDKIGDLIAQKGFQPIEIDEKQEILNSSQQEDNVIIGSEDQFNEQIPVQSPFEKWKRQTQKKKTTLKKKNSSFQYFSSDFKQIVRQLDEKKGKNSHLLSKFSSQSFDNTNRSQAEALKFEKINTDTISLQNPMNVARLLNKKFKNLAPNSPQFSFMGKTGNQKNNPNRHNQINKLLKIYQNNHKQNHVIDILFNTNYADQEHKKLQKDFIKLNLVAKLKGQRFSQLMGSNLSSQKFGTQMMKEIQEEYQKLLALKSTNKKKKLSRGQSLLSNLQQKESKQNVNIYANFDKKRKTINLDKSLEESFKKDNPQLKNSRNRFVQVNTSLFNSQNHSLDSSQSKQKKHKERKRNMRKTHQPEPSRTQKQLAVISNTFKCFQPNQFNTMNSIYGEFTNPLTKNCGYYNHENYSSLRNSLQKCEVNSIKIKKGIQKKNYFEIGSKVAFWNKIKNHDKINASKNVQTIVFNEIKDENLPQKISKMQLNTDHIPLESFNSNIFQHKLLKKHLMSYKKEELDGQKIMRSLKSDHPKTLILQNSKTQRNNIKRINRSSMLKSQVFLDQNVSKKLDKVNHKQGKSLGRDFCLHVEKIQKPNYGLNQDDLDLVIEKYLEKNKKPSGKQFMGKQFSGKDLFTKPDLSIEMTSLATSSRTSFKRIKELYSTQRRAKLQ